MAHTKQETAFTGLTNKEVLESREKFGMNLLTPPKRPSMWKLYLEKFRDPVIRILLVAAFFSLVIAIIEDEYAETIGIFFAIFLATGIGFYFEYDANKKFDLLNAVGEETPVTVMRNGKIQEIPRKDIVVGDIVILNTGEEVPADGILLEAISMQINESNLTGELMVNKTVNEELFDDEATYPSNTVMRGTTVVDGHGMMRVEHVGDATEIGKVARQATEQSQEQTPLNIQLTKLADFIGKIGFTIATLTFIIFTAKDLYGYLRQTVPQIRIVDNMVAADQTGEVEGFARCIKGERTVSGILADRLCRNVLVSVQSEVRPDFIRDDDTVICFVDLHCFFNLPALPDTTTGIVWTAEYCHMNVVGL